MYGNVLEVNESKKFAGRTYVKWIGLKIHKSDSEYNSNGITWLEKYVQDNIQSAFNMPIAVSFIDWNNEEPYDHGFTQVKDGVPLFEDSTTVGTTSNAYIDNIDVNGETIRALILEGYIFNQRYPNLLTWLKSKMYDGEAPDTSIEISAKVGNPEIIYEGGWKPEGRIPQTFDFSGSAIITVPPADNSAILLELNQFKEDKNMAKNNEELVVELNNKLDTKNDEISNLKSEINSKKDELGKVQTELDGKKTEINSLIEELKDVKEKLATTETEMNSLKEENGKLQEFKSKIDNEKLVNELNSKLNKYSDEEKEIAKGKIETFSKEPSQEKMDEIITEINSELVRKLIESRKEDKKQTEINNKADDIYSDVVDQQDEIDESELY